MKLGILFISVLVLSLINAEYYSSYVQLHKVLEYVRNSSVNAYLTDYLIWHRARLTNLRHALEFFQAIPIGTPEDMEHPVSALTYVLTAGYANTAGEQENHLMENAKVFDRAAVLNFTDLLPDGSDLEGSAVSIVTIQEIHNLRIEDIARGLMKGHQSRALTSQELTSIAKAAPHARLWNYQNSRYVSKRGLDFLMAAQTCAERSDASDLYATFLTLVDNINCTCTAYHRTIANRMRDIDPSLEVRAPCADEWDGTTSAPCPMLQSITKYKDTEQMRFEALCRGEPVRPRSDLLVHKPPRQLGCSFVHNNDPRLLLEPVKVEELSSFNPQISIIHDVIEDRHASFFMREAHDNLKRGKTTFIKTGKVKNYQKVSQQYVLPRNYSDKSELKHLRARLSALTGLSLKSFESFMIVNYASGGIYGIHMDVFSHSTKKNFTNAMNNRMVTIIMYLNDDMDGGETVFPNMGIRIAPKKHSALMFYNMYRSCDPNDFSLHSSCPVVYGTKWIANQWIGSHGQEFRYPCMLRADL